MRQASSFVGDVLLFGLTLPETERFVRQGFRVGGLDLAYVACIERGHIQRQALLLFESIRTSCGCFADAPIYAVAPRAGLGVAPDVRRTLDALRVTYIEEALNTECFEYGSANRVMAAAYVESRRRHEILVVLDSDTLFVREPRAFALPAGVDAAVRPVDVKGMCTTGPADPRDAYWRSLCEICGVCYDTVPETMSFVDAVRIKASYNGGLVVVRTALHAMQRWADFFLRSVRARLVPHASHGFRAGAGEVAPNSGRWWGSNQAALSLALWQSSKSVVEFSPVYNYPLHLAAQLPAADRVAADELVHVHYHSLFDADRIAENPLLGGNQLPPAVEALLARRTPFPSPVVQVAS